MVKLSRAGWNNVIIFSVMGFILLINAIYDDADFKQVRNDAAELLPPYTVILSLTVNQQTHIERIGKSWRALPAVISGQPLEAMMQSWQQLTAVKIAQPELLNQQNMIMVSLVLAGQEQDEYFLLFPETDRLIIFKQSTQQYFQLPKPLYTQLIPNEVK